MIFALRWLTTRLSPRLRRLLPGSQVSGGTSYVAGGIALVESFTEAAGVATFDDTSNFIEWSQDASGPTDIWWAIGYNNTNVNKEAIFFIDMAGPASLQSGDVRITWSTSPDKIFTVTVV
jgi:hypothetical protein